MTSLAIIGPFLAYWPSKPGKYLFLHSKMDWRVESLYHAAHVAAYQAKADVLFPVAEPRSSSKERWREAEDRLQRATAAFAVFVGRSEAIPAEASLALRLGLPLAIAALDSDSLYPFSKGGVPIVEARKAEPGALQQMISLLLSESAGGEAEVEFD